MKNIAFQLTTRDHAILQTLDRHPLTAEQLMRSGRRFERPFRQLRLVQRRLKKLCDAGLLKAFPYALLTGGAPRYYKLTRRGYWLVHGPDASLPKRRHFEAISPARHPHTHGLAEALLKISLAVHFRGWRLSQFTRENSVKLETEAGVVFPDCAFQIQTAENSYNYFLEFDMGTERVRSTKDAESIERKLKAYDAYQSQFQALDPNRPVALFVTRSGARLTHIISASQNILKNPNRTVVLGATLQSMDVVDDLLLAGFYDNRNRKRGLVPQQQSKSVA